MRIYPGLKPWELDRFSNGELAALIDHAARVLKEGES